METVDIGFLILTYNLIIGILIMLASDKIAGFFGFVSAAFGRYVKVSILTFGSCIATLHGLILVGLYIFI